VTPGTGCRGSTPHAALVPAATAGPCHRPALLQGDRSRTKGFATATLVVTASKWCSVGLAGAICLPCESGRGCGITCCRSGSTPCSRCKHACEAGLEAMEGQAELHMRATALLKVVVALPARLLPLVRHLPQAQATLVPGLLGPGVATRTTAAQVDQPGPHYGLNSRRGMPAAPAKPSHLMQAIHLLHGRPVHANMRMVLMRITYQYKPTQPVACRLP
jgi:hypothetical protein